MTGSKTNKQQKSILNLRAIVTTAIMSAVALILMILEFSVPFVPSFIKFDFSDLPALITSFCFGPLYGIAVCLIKNLLHIPFGSSGGVGELSNFILGAIFVGVAGLVYMLMKNRKGALIGSISGSVAMALIQLVTNYYIVYPFYTNFMPMDAIIDAYALIFPFISNLWQALLVVNLPFTLIKGLVASVICFLIYKKLSPILKYAKKDRNLSK